MFAVVSSREANRYIRLTLKGKGCTGPDHQEVGITGDGLRGLIACVPYTLVHEGIE